MNEIKYKQNANTTSNSFSLSFREGWGEAFVVK